MATALARTIGFDENLRFGAEDIEFAFRARQEAGLSVRYVPLVRSFMIRAVDLPSFARRCCRQGQAARYAATKHPGSRLEEWALTSHAYTSWNGDGPEAFDRAFHRCRKLELTLDFATQISTRADEQRRILDAAYKETFGLARALGFEGVEISIG